MRSISDEPMIDADPDDPWAVGAMEEAENGGNFPEEIQMFENEEEEFSSMSNVDIPSLTSDFVITARGDDFLDKKELLAQVRQPAAPSRERREAECTENKDGNLFRKGDIITVKPILFGTVVEIFEMENFQIFLSPLIKFLPRHHVADEKRDSLPKMDVSVSA